MQDGIRLYWDLVQVQKIDHLAAIVFGYLDHRKRNGIHMCPRHAEVAAAVGEPCDHIIRALKKLEASGLIIISRRPGASNRYTLLWKNKGGW